MTPAIVLRRIKDVARRIIPARWHGLAVRLHFRLRSLLYIGNRVECPCCGGRFRAFAPYGYEAHPPRVSCPRCGSLPRHRLLQLYFNAHPELLRPSQMVLHVAPEPIITRLLSNLPGARYISIDLEAAHAMALMDLTTLAFPAATFDLIVCNHVLEHVPDDAAAMRELRRVLRADGVAILQTPYEPAREKTLEDWTIVAPAERMRVFGQPDHVRIYGRDLVSRLEQSGWRIRLDEFVRSLPEETIARYGMFRDEDIIIGRAA